jgi:hypothetical protein
MSLTLISTTTVGAGGVSSITFSSIPATYTDLVLIASAKFSSAGYDQDQLSLRFNGDTATNYSWGQIANLVGTIGKAYNGTAAKIEAAYVPGGNIAANYMGTVKIEIPYYASANAKTVTAEWAWSRNASTASNGVNGGGWTSTSAINSITLLPFGSTTIAQYSVFSLYGRTKGSGGATVS